MRRFLCFAMAMLMLISLAACGDDKKQNNSEDDTKATQSEAAPIAEKATEKKTVGNHEVLSLDFINTFDQNPSIEEQSVYDKDGLTITATGIRYDTVNGPQVELHAENNSDQEVLIQNEFTVVNGYMVRPEINEKIAPHKKADALFSLPYLNLAMADIHSLNSVQFALRIMDSKTFQVLDTTEPIELILHDTKVIETEPAKESETDIVAYDDDHVKIVLRGVKQDTLFENRYVVLVYMQNDTDKAIAVQNELLQVNGYDLTTEMTTMLLPGTRAVDKIELYDNELDEHNIAAIDTVKASFEVNDYETWDTVCKTKTVMIEPATETAEEEAAADTATE